MRPDTDRYFMDMARLVASRSTCLRRSVGCVLVNRRNHVLATGYNGVPAGSEHCNDIDALDVTTFRDEQPAVRIAFPHACLSVNAKSGTDLDACYAVHAEQNAILQCGDTQSIERAYVTAFPCVSCLKLLMNTSCHEIVYLEAYDDNTPLPLWLERGRVARQFDGAPPMIQADLVKLFGDRDPLNEWRVVVACVCLNICSARVARSVVMRILSAWPEPSLLAKADDTLERILQPLGLKDRRASYLRGISEVWGVVRIENIPGIGPYALESVRVFCRDERPRAIVDRKVAAWVAWHDGAKGCEACPPESG